MKLRLLALLIFTLAASAAISQPAPRSDARPPDSFGGGRRDLRETDERYGGDRRWESRSRDASSLRGDERSGAASRPSPEDELAYENARIAALKAGLQLTPEQEKNWPAVESALRGNARERIERIRRFREQRDAMRERGREFDPVTRLRRAAEMMNARAAEMTRLAEAVDPLARSLDEQQRRRLGVLMRSGENYGSNDRRRSDRRTDDRYAGERWNNDRWSRDDGRPRER